MANIAGAQECNNEGEEGRSDIESDREDKAAISQIKSFKEAIASIEQVQHFLECHGMSVEANALSTTIESRPYCCSSNKCNGTNYTP